MNNIEVIKTNIRKEITVMFNKICTKDFSDCSMPPCSFNKNCCWEEFNPEGHTLKVLKRKRLRIEKYYFKFKGEVNPRNNDKILKDQIELFLGNIYEHELVKDSPETILEIKQATSLRQVVKILDRRYFKVHGKMYKSFGKYSGGKTYKYVDKIMRPLKKKYLLPQNLK